MKRNIMIIDSLSNLNRAHATKENTYRLRKQDDKRVRGIQ